MDLDAQANSTQYLTGLTGNDIPMGIADFFKQTLSSGPFSKKNQVDIYETPFDNLHVITATAELADLQPKLEAKHGDQQAAQPRPTSWPKTTTGSTSIRRQP